MEEYLIESKNKVQILKKGESIETEFVVENPGRVSTSAFAKWDRIIPIDPTKRTIELYEPNNLVPVKKKTDEGLSFITAISHKTSKQGKWKARVTNNEDAAEQFKLTVSYPGKYELRTVMIPIDLINSFLATTISRIMIHLDSGTNNSYVRFPSSLGIPKERFTVPNYTYRVDLVWPLPDIVFNERISNINSNSISAKIVNVDSNYLNGSINIKILFETSGVEIKGTLDANIGNMNLTIDLGLTAINGQISYNTNNIEVNFPITINFINIPDFLEDLVDRITGYRRIIRNSAEDAIIRIFTSPTTVQALTNSLNNEIKNVLGENSRISSVKASEGNLFVKYYTV